MACAILFLIVKKMALINLVSLKKSVNVSLLMKLHFLSGLLIKEVQND